MGTKFDFLVAKLDAAKKDAEAFYQKGNKAAGTRLRKAMVEIKALTKEVRDEVTDRKHNGSGDVNPF